MRVACLLAAVVLFAQAPSAQSEWRARPAGASVSYDALVPLEQTGFGVINEFGPSYSFRASRLLSAHLISARVPVHGGVALVAEFPIAYRDYDISPEDDARFEEIARGRLGGSDTYAPLSERHTRLGIGNPMVGAEVQISKRTTVLASLRLPVGGRGSAALGQTRLNAPDVVGDIADPERTEAYATGVATLGVGVRGWRPLGRGVSGEIGVTSYLSILDTDISLASGPFPEARTNLALVWSGALRGDAGPLGLGLHVAGRADPPNSGWTPGAGQVSFGAQAVLRSLPVRPGVQYRSSLLGNGAVLSMSLDVPLR